MKENENGLKKTRKIERKWDKIKENEKIWMKVRKRNLENMNEKKSSRKYYYRRPIVVPLETDMPHRRPVGYRHASSETRRIPTCLIGDQHVWSETHRRKTCRIRDLSETDLPDQSPIVDQHASSETDMPVRRPTLGKICISYGSPMRHVCLRWISD